MPKKLTLIFLLTFFILSSHGQIERKDFFDSCINIPGYFIYKEPVKTIRISKEDIIDYYWQSVQDKMMPIDTSLLIELFENTKLIDTSAWTDSEIMHYFLVGNNYVNVHSVIEKLNVRDPLKKEFLRQQVANLNNPQTNEKGVCRISRPSFDKTRQNALVQFQYTTSENEGTFVIKFFAKVNQKWQEGLIIKEWRARLTNDAKVIQ